MAICITVILTENFNALSVLPLPSTIDNNAKAVGLFKP